MGLKSAFIACAPGAIRITVVIDAARARQY
jgi:hypothetical protein